VEILVAQRLEHFPVMCSRTIPTEDNLMMTIISIVIARSEATWQSKRPDGLPRRFAPRNDGVFVVIIKSIFSNLCQDMK
jgi:hypothetical protein